MNSTPLRPLVGLLSGALALATLAACGVSVDSGDGASPSTAVSVGSQTRTDTQADTRTDTQTGTTATGSATAPAESTPVETLAPVPAGAVSLADRVAGSGRPVTRSAAEVKGDTGGPREDALSLWAGCDGGVDEVVFDVSGHKVFQMSLGLRANVPDDMKIEILVLTDGEPVKNLRLDGTDPTPALLPVRVLAEGRSTVTTRTKVVAGTCSTEAESYVVAVNGYVD